MGIKRLMKINVILCHIWDWRPFLWDDSGVCEGEDCGAWVAYECDG